VLRLVKVCAGLPPPDGTKLPGRPGRIVSLSDQSLCAIHHAVGERRQVGHGQRRRLVSEPPGIELPRGVRATASVGLTVRRGFGDEPVGAWDGEHLPIRIAARIETGAQRCIADEPVGARDGDGGNDPVGDVANRPPNFSGFQRPVDVQVGVRHRLME